MVNHEVMRLNELERLPYKLLHTRCIDQFTAGIIGWYQEEVTTTSVFWESGTRSLTPNLFHLFEYPNLYSDIIFNQFIKSGELRLEIENEVQEGLEVIAARHFQEHFIDLYEYMLNDIELILNKYCLSYSYKDDAIEKETFYNLPIRGVW